VIYQAAGGTGAGVFSEAKALNETRTADDKVWVIGVDRDQSGEGSYKDKDGKEANFVLTSTIKGVGQALIKIANETEKGEFPGGQTITLGLSDGAISLTDDQLSDDAKSAVAAAEKGIKDGSIVVSATPSK
jgi:basic membrane lipoprotein Med (substrate-binding protein (PBP1-ABC) superfamily)